MDIHLKEKFLAKWQTYFPGAALPIAFFYSDNEAGATRVKGPKSIEIHRCILADIMRATKGRSLAFDVHSIGCGGGKRYLGFTEVLRPKFEYFLSYGVPGELEGERYKKTPEIVTEIMKKVPRFDAPGRYAIFKRWDMIDKTDEPVVVIFFATPDVISGLFTLANFDEKMVDAVFTPFGAGCSSIVSYPYLENRSKRPRCVLGMFDVSARPCVPQGILSFAVPFRKLQSMVDNMDESFLTTPSWGKVRKRIARDSKT